MSALAAPVTAAADTSGASASSGDRAGEGMPGSVRISAHALVRTARAVAAEALRTRFTDVRVRVSDDGDGALAVEVTSPLALPVLGSGAVPLEPVVVTAHRARQAIADRLRAVTGRQVRRVSVVFGSSVVDAPGRVR